MFDALIADLIETLLDSEEPLQSLESQLKCRIGLPAEAPLDLTA